MITFKTATQLLLVILVLLVFSFATSVFAQCNFPACNQEGERYDPATGDCESGPDPITLARSHRVPACLRGEHFDRATGNCVLDACADSGCEVRTLCPAKTRYSRSGRDSRGFYGVCESSSGFGYRSHELRYCPEGFTLNTARGVCVGNCRPAVTRLPDLIFSRAFLRQDPGGALVTRIRAGQRYFACFEVANIGAVESGPFRVSGGGLGIRTAPTQDHASLMPGANREGCLVYPTTPSIGTFRLGLTVDSLRVVRERREDNNTATVAVTVVAR